MNDAEICILLGAVHQIHPVPERSNSVESCKNTICKKVVFEVNGERVEIMVRRTGGERV